MLLTGNDRLCEEVVLLISSAKCKNIDVSIWLTEDGSDGKITAPDFNSKLISLGLIVGMGEDCDKKGKLDYATSDASLGRIHSLCYGGEDSHGTPFVDVTEFLHLCSKMLTTSINQSILTSRSVYPLADSVEILTIERSPKTFTSNNARYGQKDDDIADTPRSVEHRTAVADYNAPFDRNAFNQTDDENVGLVLSGQEYPEVPKSDRYSEEYFEELKKANQWRPGNPKEHSLKSMEALFFEKDEVENADDKPTYSEEPIRTIRTANTGIESSRSMSSDPRRNSSGQPIRIFPTRSSSRISGSKVFTPHTIKRNATSSEILEFQIQGQLDTVENLARTAVRHTDLYHLIQVHLGFIECYTFVPPRGKIVQSIPRQYLTLQDIQTAFQAARVNFNEIHLLAFSKLVEKFSKEYLIRQQKTGSSHQNKNENKCGSDEIIKKNEDNSNNKNKIESDGENEYEDNEFECEEAEEKENKKEIKQKNEKIIKRETIPSPLSITIPPLNVISPNGKINSDWVRKYLIDLRLSRIRTSTIKKTQKDSERGGVRGSEKGGGMVKLKGSSIQSASVCVDKRGSGRGSVRGSEGASERGVNENIEEDKDKEVWNASTQRPVPWEQWLGNRVAADRQILTDKPKEFRKALAGKPYKLSRKDIELFLKGHEIIPKEIMTDEINYQIDCWKSDSYGRRDFSHLLNVEFRKWEIKKKNDLKLLRQQQVLKGEEIYLAPTSNSEKESVKKTLAKELINRKIASIQLSERTDASVTTDLFWKYDKYCSENGHKGCSVWGDWLYKYSETRKRDFTRVTMENKERSNLCEAVIQRKKFVGGLQEIQLKIMTYAKSLPTDQSVELNKSLALLRKVVLSRAARSEEENILVTREDFDFYFGNFLAPRLNKLPTEIKLLINRVEKEKTRKDVKRNMDCDNDDIGNDEKRKTIVNKNDNKENEGDGDYDDEFEIENDNDDINAVKEKKERNILIKEEDDMHTRKNKNENTDNADDDESNQSNNFFTLNEEKAFKRIVELKEENRIRKDKEFSEWKGRKDSQMKREEMREKTRIQEIEEKRKLREKKGKKAYNKWLRLAKENIYISKVDGKKRSVPVGNIVNHDSPWNQEMDLKNHYSEDDKKYF